MATVEERHQKIGTMLVSRERIEEIQGTRVKG
jgi:hypothetical protein